MTREESLRVAREVAEAGLAAANGDKVGVGRHVITALFEAIPDAEERRQLLDEEAVRRANARAEALEHVKFANELDEPG